MTQLDFQKYRTELRYRLAFYVSGLLAAFVLALFGSQYAGEAFALLGGFLGGDAIGSQIRSGRKD